jgi:hypothetical protein
MNQMSGISVRKERYLGAFEGTASRGRARGRCIAGNFADLVMSAGAFIQQFFDFRFACHNGLTSLKMSEISPFASMGGETGFSGGAGGKGGDLLWPIDCKRLAMPASAGKRAPCRIRRLLGRCRNRHVATVLHFFCAH